MSTTFKESIRRSTTLPAFSQSLAEVHFHPHQDFASLQVFTCDRLNSVLTKEACKANYTRQNAPLSCKGCPIGSAHAGGENYRTERGDIHAKSDAAVGLPCIRCERNEHTATRYISRFRLVSNHTICINCFNRGREVEKFRAGLGGNAKGGVPQKWAHLKQATITIEDAAGEWQTLDIGLRASRGECDRYVARIHPGCVLVDVFMDGKAMKLGDPDIRPANWKADAVRKGHATIASRKVKPLPVASDREAFSDVDDCWPSRNAPEVEAVESALDPESIAAFWDFTADGLADFAEWLCKGVDDAAADADRDGIHSMDTLADAEGRQVTALTDPDPLLRVDDDGGVLAYAPAEPAAPVEYLSEVTGNPWTGFVVTKRPIGEPVEPSAPVADAIAPVEVAKAAIEPVRDPMDEAISKLEAIKNPSRQVRRELGRLHEKRERRNTRLQQQNAKYMPATKAKATAIASRALAIFDSMSAAAR
jgi:hypothetical protein